MRTMLGNPISRQGMGTQLTGDQHNDVQDPVNLEPLRKQPVSQSARAHVQGRKVSSGQVVLPMRVRRSSTHTQRTAGLNSLKLLARMIERGSRRPTEMAMRYPCTRGLSMLAPDWSSARMCTGLQHGTPGTAAQRYCRTRTA